MTHHTRVPETNNWLFEVHNLEWDKQNEEHIAEHGLSVREVNQVVANPNVIVRNRRMRRAQYLMIGRTHSGRVVTVALAKTRTVGSWKPVTAHPSTKAQRRVLEKHAGSGPKE